MASPDLKEIIDHAGFTVAPGVLDADAVSELIAALSRLPREEGVRRRGTSAYAARNLLQISPEVRRLASSAPLRALVEPVLGAEASAVRATLFDKTANANWNVAWHQDLTIAVRGRVEAPGFERWSVKAGVQHVQPPTPVLEGMLAVRVHLDDCGSGNGALRVLPGSHAAGRLSGEAIREWRERSPAVTCEVARGGILLLRPLLLHASSEAVVPGHRRVIHLEYAAEPLPGGLEWLHGVR